MFTPKNQDSKLAASSALPLKKRATATGMFGAAVFALAFILSLFYANSLNIWYDEAITLLQLSGNAQPDWPSGIKSTTEFKALFSGNISWYNIVAMLEKTDVHPPLYYSVAWFFHQLSPALFSVRMLSVLAVALSAGVFFNAGTVLREYGWIVVLILGMFYFSPQVQWAAVNARGYGLALLFTTLTLVSFIKFFNWRDNASYPAAQIQYWLYAAAIFAGLAFWTHYFTILITAPLLGVLFMFSYRVSFRDTAVSGGILIISISVMIPVVAEQFNSRPHQYSGFSTFDQELLFLTRLVLHIFSDHIEDLWVGRLQLMFMAGLYCLGVYTILKRRKPPFLFAIVVAPIIFVILLVALFYITDKSLMNGGTSRYIIFIIPFLSYLVAEATSKICSWSKILGGIVVFALVAQLGYTWYDFTIRWQPWNNQYISDLVSDLDRPGGVLVVVPEGYGRGVPGVWAYQMPKAYQMVVSTTGTNLSTYDILKFDNVVLVDSELDEFANKHQQISQTLTSNQYGVRRYPGATLYRLSQ